MSSIRDQFEPAAFSTQNVTLEILQAHGTEAQSP